MLIEAIKVSRKAEYLSNCFHLSWFLTNALHIEGKNQQTDTNHTYR